MEEFSQANVLSFIEESVADEMGRLAKNITIEVKDNTPVDTGHAMSNWMPSIGTPFTGINGSKTNVSEGDYSNRLANLSSYQLKNGDIFISNNVDYITLLNEGSSRQAPRAFVQIAMEVGAEQTRRK